MAEISARLTARELLAWNHGTVDGPLMRRHEYRG